MPVGLCAAREWLWVGETKIMVCFFSTVCHHLEKGQWGSRFPYLMNHLYEGDLYPEDVAAAGKELDQIREELKELPPTGVVWDIDDLSKEYTWDDDIGEVKDLLGYFMRPEGEGFMDGLFQALEKAETVKGGVHLMLVF